MICGDTPYIENFVSILQVNPQILVLRLQNARDKGSAASLLEEKGKDVLPEGQFFAGEEHHV